MTAEDILKSIHSKLTQEALQIISGWCFCVFCVHYTTLWILNKLTVINCVVQKCLGLESVKDYRFFWTDAVVKLKIDVVNVDLSLWKFDNYSAVINLSISVSQTPSTGLWHPSSNHCHKWLHLTKKNCQLMGSFHWCSNSSKFVSDNSGYMRCLFYSAHIACASTNKTEVLWIEKELNFYPGQTCLGFMCVLGCYATSTVLLVLKPLGGRWHHWRRAAPSVL